ncbi:MAG: DMT family transporter [Candidatus Binataceae bacterium]
MAAQPRRSRHYDTRRVGAACGLGAAVLFGASTPFSKLLLAQTDPLLLAGFLYLGAAVGLTLMSPLARFAASLGNEARIRRADAPALAAITLIGGVAGPVLMLEGLTRVSALAGSLLLNLEAPFTMVIAVVLFREHLGLRATLGGVCVVIGAALVGYGSGEIAGTLVGCIWINAACLCWALDNNLSQQLSVRSPLTIARVKSVGAAVAMLSVAFSLGTPVPDATYVAAALMLGAFSYGLSLALDMYALRLLGAAREAAYFATAPFLGAALALPIVGDRSSLAHLAIALLMAAGVALLLGERHSHQHAHQFLDHEHVHFHDEHHQHTHEVDSAEPHSHPHRHAQLSHSHPHVSDLHHRHRHV